MRKKQKTEISSEELADFAKAASRRAVERAQVQGISVVSQEGEQIVRHHSDGKTEVLSTIPKPFVTPAKRRYKLR